ncbi:HD domain-containing protein, partial [Candidatus Berkelbacteria bacterium]|nr:HD domain-containing protein [Candidatus Berkelbacteria bacterium]
MQPPVIDGYVYDRLYGKIPYSPPEARLFQTKELARLREVSLAAVPGWTTPAGVCASKFEHSLGVAHLARLLAERFEFQEIRFELFAAALAHDIGTPPFSHLSEQYLRWILDKNHEDYATDVIEGSEFAKVIKDQGGDINLVLKLIQGKYPPVSDVINGSIDLDNLDNTLRYGISMGLLRPWEINLYSPEKIARGFVLREGQLCLEERIKTEIAGWAKCRQKVYDYVFSTQNLAPGTMISRAIEWARRESQIPPQHFLKT